MEKRASPRVAIAVTHLLGIGHFARMVALARALQSAGMTVRLLSGGRPVPMIATDGLDLVQLPPVHCRDADFSVLYKDDGERVDTAFLELRAASLAAGVRDWQPDAVLAELYPFGRRSLRAEFEAMIAVARAMQPRPAIICSIRDVLNPPKSPERAANALEALGKSFDAIFVHGDEAALPLDASWPVEPALARKLVYTGFLRDGARSAMRRPASGRHGIIVSAGGSDVGKALNVAAIGAAANLSQLPWRILVSRTMPQTHLDALIAAAPAHVRIEWARPDFPDLLTSARISISQAGYNTVLDLAASGPGAILVPFAQGGEKEQSLRAAALEKAGLVRVIPEDQISPARLETDIRDLLAAPLPDWSSIHLDGAERSVAALGHQIKAARARDEGWKALEQALRGAARRGVSIPVWIRDDDAIAPTKALDDFLALIGKHGAPLGLAVIPHLATEELARRLEGVAAVDVMVHGWQHRNHAAPGEKAAEFGASRVVPDADAELRNALARLRGLFGTMVLPVFVPPWNRIGEPIARRLPQLGFCGLSTFARWQPSLPVRGLVLSNTHWDPIDWRGTRGLAPEEKMLQALAALVEERALHEQPLPIGLLTHHLVHDVWVTRFLDEILERLAQSGAVRFVRPSALFGTGQRG